MYYQTEFTFGDLLDIQKALKDLLDFKNDNDSSYLRISCERKLKELSAIIKHYDQFDYLKIVLK